MFSFLNNYSFKDVRILDVRPNFEFKNNVNEVKNENNNFEYS